MDDNHHGPLTRGETGVLLSHRDTVVHMHAAAVLSPLKRFPPTRGEPGTVPAHRVAVWQPRRDWIDLRAGHKSKVERNRLWISPQLVMRQSGQPLVLRTLESRTVSISDRPTEEP